MDTPLFSHRLDYIRTLFAEETALQTAARTAAQVENDDNISLLPEEAALLRFMARLIDARRIVEIGTFYGYSALWLADALGTDGHLWTIEKDPQRAQRARTFLSDRPDISLIEGDALQALGSLVTQGPFDMVFIDADKVNYEHYLDWAEKNLRTGGLIVADNTFLFDAVWHDAPTPRVRESARTAMRNFNQRLADRKKYTAIMLDTEQGLTIAQKR